MLMWGIAPTRHRCWFLGIVQERGLGQIGIRFTEASNERKNCGTKLLNIEETIVEALKQYSAGSGGNYNYVEEKLHKYATFVTDLKVQ